jgi:hypothetical protein
VASKQQYFFLVDTQRRRHVSLRILRVPQIPEGISCAS